MTWAGTQWPEGRESHGRWTSKLGEWGEGQREEPTDPRATWEQVDGSQWLTGWEGEKELWRSLEETWSSGGGSAPQPGALPPASQQGRHYGWLTRGQVTFLWRSLQIHQRDRWGMWEEGSACSSQSWILDSSHYVIDLLSNSGILSLKNQ